MPEPTQKTSSRGAILVAAGILLSRLVGLVRERVFAHYLGNSMAAAAFKAALRIPNFLQNLFGEGVLSASFIPVYAGLIGKKEHDEADKVAGAVFGLLSLLVAILVAAGVVASPALIDAIAPGFEGEARTLTITIVRILFPATGLLVLSAWCLGILNSHRKFFLSYAAPVVWNVALIATMFIFGGRSTQEELVVWLAWGTVLGSFLQFAIQLPNVFQLLGKFRPTVKLANSHAREVLKNFGPVVVGRGVVQVSAWVDTAYATMISARAVSALSYAQTLYLIPISLFGMAISAAELPEMAQTTGTDEEIAAKLRNRIDAALKRMAFFVVPSAAAFLFLGDVVAAALLQTGKFGPDDSRYLWYLLMGSTVGLLASTMGRLYSSSFYALKDTRTPLYFAMIRVALVAALAYWSALHLPEELGLPRYMGAVGITVTSGTAAWIEFTLLRRTLNKRIGKTGLPASRLLLLWGIAAASAAAGVGVKLLLVRIFGASPLTELGGGLLPAPALHPILVAGVVLGTFGVLYLGGTAIAGVPEASRLLRRRR